MSGLGPSGGNPVPRCGTDCARRRRRGLAPLEESRGAQSPGRPRISVCIHQSRPPQLHIRDAKPRQGRAGTLPFFSVSFAAETRPTSRSQPCNIGKCYTDLLKLFSEMRALSTPGSAKEEIRSAGGGREPAGGAATLLWPDHICPQLLTGMALHSVAAGGETCNRWSGQEFWSFCAIGILCQRMWAECGIC